MLLRRDRGKDLTGFGNEDSKYETYGRRLRFWLAWQKTNCGYPENSEMALLGNNLAWKSWHRLALDSLSEGVWSEKFLFHARVYANSHPWGLERYKAATWLHTHCIRIKHLTDYCLPDLICISYKIQTLFCKISFSVKNHCQYWHLLTSFFSAQSFMEKSHTVSFLSHSELCRPSITDRGK